MTAMASELRIAGRLALLGLVTAWAFGLQIATTPGREASSRAALRAAEELREAAETLAYDDPRLAPTQSFVDPERSLARARDGYERSWRIVEHVPARFMKTIEIRVRWSRPGPDGELVLTTVKAS